MTAPPRYTGSGDPRLGGDVAPAELAGEVERAAHARVGVHVLVLREAPREVDAPRRRCTARMARTRSA